MTHIVNPVRKLLRRVRFFEGDIEYIDLNTRRVGVSHGQVTATAIRRAARDHAHSFIDDAAAFGATDRHAGHRKLHEERERPRAPDENRCPMI